MAPTRVGLFAGSATGASPAHLVAARSLAEAMHAHSMHLVYGGGTTGLMGEVARTLVALSGKESVHGIIPSSKLGIERPGMSSKQKQLPRNWSSRAVSSDLSEELGAQYGRVTIVSDLQARKKLMMELVKAGGDGSGFIALSGGIGTIDEVMEILSWRQMGVHECQTVLLNVDGLWDGIFIWMRKVIEEGFVREKGKHILVEAKDAKSALTALSSSKG